MITYIGFKEKTMLPSMEELVYYIWARDINFSFFKTGRDICDSTEISLSWDKWLDNAEWSGNEKSKEYINFTLYPLCNIKNAVTNEFYDFCMLSNFSNVLEVEINDNAIMMDKRAFARAIYYISKNCNGYIQWQNSVIDVDHYFSLNEVLIKTAFDFSVTYA